MRYMPLVSEEQARRFTRSAAVAAALVAALTFAASATHSANMNWWGLLDVAILLGLGYGVLRANVYCAIGLLLYHVANAAYKAVVWGHAPGATELAIGAFYALGIIGALSTPRG